MNSIYTHEMNQYTSSVHMMEGHKRMESYRNFVVRKIIHQKC